MKVVPIQKQHREPFKTVLFEFLKYANNQLPTDDQFHTFFDGEIIAESTIYFLGCFDNDDLLGIVSINIGRTSYKFSAFGYCDDLFVLEAHRGRGVARLLMEAVNELARSHECSCVMLGVGNDETGLHGFYESIGFKDLGCKIFSHDL